MNRAVSHHLLLALMLLLLAAAVPVVARRGDDDRSGPVRRMLLHIMDRRAQSAQAVLKSREIPLVHDGRQRRYLVHEPEGKVPERGWPVVLAFHGGGGSAPQFLSQVGLEALAERERFLLVAPDGTGQARNILHTWNVFFGFGHAERHEVDDLGFVDTVLDDLESRFRIDPRRLFATGISNGAILCHWLAAQPGNRLAAIAPVVGALGGRHPGERDWKRPPRPATPVSVLAIQGRRDDHVPIEGGLQRKSVGVPREMLSAEQTIRFWVRANECSSPARSWYDARLETRFTLYSEGRAGTEVELAVIENQGHAWPGAPKVRWRGDAGSPTFDANRVIWSFFEAHPRIR